MSPKHRVTQYLHTFELHDFNNDISSSTASLNLNVTRSQKVALASVREKTMRNFIVRGERKEEVGGIFWTWWKYFDGTLFDHEGLWIHTRLYVIQVAQVAIALFVTALFFIFGREAAIAADDWRDSLTGLPD